MRPEVPTTILVVDDNDDDWEVLHRSFKEAEIDCTLRRVIDGQQALDYLHHDGKFNSQNAPRPGLILLDINMPGIDGKDVLKRIKSEEKLKKIPVYILTTSQNERDVEECYEFGANSYMCKPADYAESIKAAKRMKDFVFENTKLPKV